jgi:hypothetical protein
MFVVPSFGDPTVGLAADGNPFYFIVSYYCLTWDSTFNKTKNRLENIFGRFHYSLPAIQVTKLRMAVHRFLIVPVIFYSFVSFELTSPFSIQQPVVKFQDPNKDGNSTLCSHVSQHFKLSYNHHSFILIQKLCIIHKVLHKNVTIL